MSLTVNCESEAYDFDGPYNSTSELKDKSGVYVICSFYNDKYYIIDVGESAKVKNRVENHDRSQCWNKNNNGGTLKVAVYYTPNLQEEGRREIETNIRDFYDPPCGKQ